MGEGARKLAKVEVTEGDGKEHPTKAQAVKEALDLESHPMREDPLVAARQTEADHGMCFVVNLSDESKSDDVLGAGAAATAGAKDMGASSGGQHVAAPSVPEADIETACARQKHQP